MGGNGVEGDGYIGEDVLVLGEVGGGGGLWGEGDLQEVIGFVWEGVDLEDGVSLGVTWCLGEEAVFGLLGLLGTKTGDGIEG